MGRIVPVKPLLSSALWLPLFIDYPLAGGQVRDITDPQRMWSHGLGHVLDPIGVAMEAVVRIHGLGVTPFGSNEEPLLTQQGTRGIHAYRPPPALQQRRDFVVSLARTKARQLGAHGRRAGGGRRFSGLKIYEMRGITTTPVQYRRAALNAVLALGLLIT